MKSSMLNKILALVTASTMTLGGTMLATTMTGNNDPNDENLQESLSNEWVEPGEEELDLTLLEDETTVDERVVSRASTYRATPETKAEGSVVPQADGTQLVYFPATMFNYDDRIDNATHQLEVDASLAAGGNGSPSQWNGLYFGAAYPGTKSYTYNTKSNWSNATVRYNTGGDYSAYENTSYYVQVDDEYKLVTKIQNGTQGCDTVCLVEYEGGQVILPRQSGLGYYYITLRKSGTKTTSTLQFADHNFWTDYLPDRQQDYGDDTKSYIYSGLVEKEMVNNQIKFTVPEGGIFDTADTSTKDVYTNVGIPFVFDSSTGYYILDVTKNAVHFANEPASDTLLDWHEGTQTNQSRSGVERKAGFYPFNAGHELDGFDSYWGGNERADYHFGMNLSVGFSMTVDGKHAGKDIEFNFDGDDDVWVFIDGKLVLDLGGIHDSVDGRINFATNRVEYKATNNTGTGDASGAFKETATGENWILQQKIFDDEEGKGALEQTRTTFAATTNHTMTIYYLERGEGDSDCKITFNLPREDYISVTKSIDNNLYGEDGEVIGSVSNELKESLSNRAYQFIVYEGNTPLSGINYIIFNANGEAVGTGTTDSDGIFRVRLGQTVRLMIENINAEYRVEEINLGNAYMTPGWSSNGQAADGYSVAQQANGYNSETISANGSESATDYINFTCTNKLVYPVADVVNDTIVIDYGIPVTVDVLYNDSYIGLGDLEVVGLSETEENAPDSSAATFDGKFGTAQIVDNKVVYTLDKQMTGVETLYYNVALADDETNASVGIARLRIIPATTMYYEENFTGLVTFTDGTSATWQSEGTSDTFHQEEGRISDITSSPYGSDVGYIKNDGDSYGTSKYVSTTGSYAQFSYQFTGTGTSFFARIGKESPYLSITVKDQDGKTVATKNRNTIYTPTEGTDLGELYNIPVYTVDKLPYGTYTVNVTVSKGVAALNRGSEFYFDGIRVINPVFDPETSESSLDRIIATNAYANHGEANNTNVTLRDKLIADSMDANEDGILNWSEVTETDQADNKFVVFTDTNGAIKNASEYVSNGPKEEVYLNKGQSITFSLTGKNGWDADANRIYLGMKTPTGNVGKVEINGRTVSIGNTVDSYYYIPAGYADISIDEQGKQVATFTVEATEQLISITNIRVTGNVIFTIVDGGEN